jgi:hypothetical protein
MGGGLRRRKFAAERTPAGENCGEWVQQRIHKWRDEFRVDAFGEAHEPPRTTHADAVLAQHAHAHLPPNLCAPGNVVSIIAVKGQHLRVQSDHAMFRVVACGGLTVELTSRGCTGGTRMSTSRLALPHSPTPEACQSEAVITPEAVGLRLRRWWAPGRSEVAPEAVGVAPQAVGCAWGGYSKHLRRRLERAD